MGPTSEAILDLLFPSGITTKFRHDIAFFTQQKEETLYEACERYDDLLRRCSQHGLLGWMEVQTFYQGLTPIVRQTIDAAASGAIANKTPEEARKLFDDMVMNSYQWIYRGKQVKATGVFEEDAMTALVTQVELLSNKIDRMITPREATVMSCETCSRGHFITDCPIVSVSLG